MVGWKEERQGGRQPCRQEGIRRKEYEGRNEGRNEGILEGSWKGS